MQRLSMWSILGWSTVAGLLTLLLFLALDETAHGQTITIADDSSSGTYHQIIGEIKQVCDGSGFTIDEKPAGGGALGNLNQLFDNQVIAAVMHTDVLMGKSADNDDYKQLKTLVALFPEDAHFIALRQSKTKKLGWSSFGTIDFENVESIGPGYKVGAAGGGVMTLRVLKGTGGATFDIAEFNSGKEMMDALDSGQISVALFVGASPLPNVSKLSSQYKLVSIGANLASRVSGKYDMSTISYPNLGTAQTIAPRALIVTWPKHIPWLVKAQTDFRACVYNHLAELQETPGFHRKWKMVDPNNHGKWDWYDLPSAQKLR